MPSTTKDILLLDIGNSRIKWGTLDGEGYISGIGSRPHRLHGVGNIAKHCWLDMSPYRVVASNVAGNTLACELQEWVWATWQLEVEFLRPEAQAHGVVNAYRNPTLLGSDRWAALLGAARRPHGPLCIVDCGTAVTMDAITSDNIHLGGFIVPGLELMRDSLITGTAGIRHACGTEETAFLARDTGSAVAGGTLYTIVALIDRVVADLTAELCATVTVLLTGGDAALMVPLLASPVEYEADLVFHGLAIVAGTHHPHGN